MGRDLTRPDQNLNKGDGILTIEPETDLALTSQI